MASLIEDIWNGYVLQESAKVQRRLGITQAQQQDFNVPSSPTNVQAHQGGGVSTGTRGIDTRTLLIGGGVLAAVAVFYLVMK